MIHPDSRSIEWIRQVAKENDMSDLTLVEKTIRAFSLLEALVRSGCPFLFKGGTSTMLHLNSAKRISIDIDILCPPGTPIEDYLDRYATEYGFGHVQVVERILRTDIPKKHAKFFYQVAYPSNGSTDKILLDVLFEDIHYASIVERPIHGRFIKQDGDPVMVKVPSVEDLLGDKLTAFAPHTTGIPFFKGEKNCSMEICKQLFDIASLFDITSDLSTTITTFHRFASVELAYRGMETKNVQAVLDDIFNTALCISLRGQVDAEEFNLLKEGVSRVRGFIHSENYILERAINNASKAAYLSKLIEKGITVVRHFNPDTVMEMTDAVIDAPLSTKLNKLKKSDIEAFFYWNEIQKLINRG